MGLVPEDAPSEKYVWELRDLESSDNQGVSRIEMHRNGVDFTIRMYPIFYKAGR